MMLAATHVGPLEQIGVSECNLTQFVHIRSHERINGVAGGHSAGSSS